MSDCSDTLVWNLCRGIALAVEKGDQELAITLLRQMERRSQDNLFRQWLKEKYPVIAEHGNQHTADLMYEAWRAGMYFMADTE